MTIPSEMQKKSRFDHINFNYKNSAERKCCK